MSSPHHWLMIDTPMVGVNDSVEGSDAIATIFATHYDRVFRLAISMSGNRASAEDICQETFVAVAKGLPDFRNEARLSTWIHRIALRIGSRWIAKNRERPLPYDGESHTMQDLPIDLIRAIQALPATARAVVLLAGVEGLTHREVADVLRIPEGTVASRLHHAKKRLRIQLTDP